MNRITLRDLLGPARVPFLVLTPACVLVGIGTAWWTTGAISVFHSVLALAGAVLAHVSVNAFNEYSDFRSGLDFHTHRTPFSGGSGTLPQKPHLALATLTLGIGTAFIDTLMGIYFIAVGGWGFLPIIVLGLLLIVAYTPRFTRNPWLCLLAPGLGFGPCMVMGTHYVLTGRYEMSAFWASLVPFFLVNNLLLLNQFPDLEADLKVGRRHLPIVLGRRPCALIYAGFMALAYVVLLSGVFHGFLPLPTLAALVTVPLAIPTTWGVYRYADNRVELIPYMKKNVAISVITPTLMAVGFLIAGFS